MIGKAIAGEAKATFFYISASSLTSKWASVFSLALVYDYSLTGFSDVISNRLAYFYIAS